MYSDIFIYEHEYVCACLLHMHAHTPMHTISFNKVFEIHTTAYWTPTIPREHCHVLTHQTLTHSTGLLSEFLHFTNGS